MKVEKGVVARAARECRPKAAEYLSRFELIWIAIRMLAVRRNSRSRPLYGISSISRYLPLVVILAAAGFLRLHRAATDPPLNDETFTWRIISRDWAEMWAPIVSDSHPPLHHVLLKLWTGVVGTSLIGMRSFSAVCGLASVVIVYLLVLNSGRHFSGKQVQRIGTDRHVLFFEGPSAAATLAAILMACHAVQVMAGRVARMYGLGVVLCALLSFVLVKALQGGRRRERWWVAYGIVAACCMYTHYYLLFCILAHVMFVGIEASGCLASRLRGVGDSSLGGGVRNARTVEQGTAWVDLERMAWSLTLGMALYLPWVPVLLSWAAPLWVMIASLSDWDD